MAGLTSETQAGSKMGFPGISRDSIRPAAACPWLTASAMLHGPRAQPAIQTPSRRVDTGAFTGCSATKNPSASIGTSRHSDRCAALSAPERAGARTTMSQIPSCIL